MAAITLELYFFKVMGAKLPKVQTTFFGVKSKTYFGNRLWEVLLQEIKHENTPPIKKQNRC